LAWSSSPAELTTGATSIAVRAEISVTENNQALRLIGDDSEQGDQLISVPINIQKGSDYVLRLPVKLEEGRMVIKIERVDNGKILASANIPDSLEPTEVTKDSGAFVQLPFVSDSADKIRIVAANAATKRVRPVIQIGRVEIFRLGPASYLWTRYPRVLVKSIQKFFKTAWMLPLALIGIVLLSLARRGSVLAITLIVPAYYLCIQSPLHMEHRYVLAMHYFFSILIAVTLYWLGKRFREAAQKLVASRLHRKVPSN
jgi:hypothetical protein